MVFLPVWSVKVNLSVKPSVIKEWLKNPHNAMQLVYKQYEIAKDVVMMEMQQSLKRFCLPLDEYSSLKHKRYMNIDVYQDKDKFWNFAMVAISGRMTAEKLLKK